MEKLESIENRLKRIAAANNMSGDSVDLIIKLLSYSYYESLTATNIALLESQPDRAVHLNSKIEHAMNEMYSIYRGKNAYIEVPVTVIGNPKYERFQEVFSDRNNKFFYSHCVNEKEGLTVGPKDFNYKQEYTLFLIKADRVVEEIFEVKEENTMLLESLSNDISQDYELKKVGVGELPIKFTQEFADHIDSSVLLGNPNDTKNYDENRDEELFRNTIGFELTTPGYGVRLYAPDYRGFTTTSEGYKFTYLPFNPTNIEREYLSKFNLKGFEVDVENIKIYKSTPRESVENFLYNLKKEQVTQARVRSNDDVVDEFRSFFTTRVVDAINHHYDYQKDILTIAYIPINSNDKSDDRNTFTDAEYKSWLDKLMYYVTKDIVLKPVYDEDNAVYLDLKVEMIINKEVNQDDLIKKVLDLEYKLEGEFNYDEFVGYVNNLDGVRYCTVEATIENEPLSESIVKLKSDQYFIITRDFTSTYRN